MSERSAGTAPTPACGTGSGYTSRTGGETRGQGPALFDLKADPAEEHNVLRENLSVAEELRGLLADQMKVRDMPSIAGPERMSSERPPVRSFLTRELEDLSVGQQPGAQRGVIEVLYSHSSLDR